MTTHFRDRSTEFIEPVARDAPPIQRIRLTQRYGSMRVNHGLQRLSVIIPTYNEEKSISRTLDQVHGGSIWEVIVVDGGSTDQTREIARKQGATVIESPPGRARQLTAGASVATGDALLFLHADTLLPFGFVDYIMNSLSSPGVSAGAFRLIIDAEGFSFRLIEKMVNIRSHIRQMPYGDQAIFVTTDRYHEVGGFQNLPIMEDYALIKRLQCIGRIEIAPAPVVTSARRWIKYGVWRTTLRNQICIAAFRLGISPAKMTRWRR